MSNITIQKTPTAKAKPSDNALGFGKYFSDHMFLVDYTEEKGWHDARIVPYGPFSLDPATTVFHYAQEIFEGLKAYRTPDNKINLFRPEENAKRMALSCERMCMQEVPVDLFVNAVKELVKVDKDWVPSASGTSLYIRPFIFASEIALGVHAARAYTFCVITSPVGAYYADGLNPIRIYVEDEDVRAVKGGTGFAKCGGNYAASIRACEKAQKNGYAQVLWLDGVHRKYVEEVGAMNIMFKIGNKIITPALSGSVLPGITRNSCLTLLKDWGYEVEERLISIDELFEAAEKGIFEEAFGTGTAAVISPVKELAWNDKQVILNNGEIGPVSQRLYNVLTGIQYGTEEDKHQWTVSI